MSAACPQTSSPEQPSGGHLRANKETCLPHALKLHHQNSPQVDTSGQRKRHVCRMPSNSITRTALRWTPQGKERDMSAARPQTPSPEQPSGGHLMAKKDACLPHALKLHHQNSPQVDTTGQRKRHVCRMPSNSITRTALWWTPQGKERDMSAAYPQTPSPEQPSGGYLRAKKETCLPHALKLHHQNSPQVDTSGKRKRHVCRMPSNSITRTALRWTPQGKERGMSAACPQTPSPEQPSGRHLVANKETWRRIVEKNLNIWELCLDVATRAAAADRALCWMPTVA